MSTFQTPKGTKLPILNLRGKDYMQVAQRLVWFREERPAWTIWTEIIKHDDRSALIKATVKNENGHVVATAHKSEEKAHFGDFIEKAETGAIGRALALCGFGTQFAEIEFEEGTRIVDSPQGNRQQFTVNQQPSTPGQPASQRKANLNKPVTQPQLKRLHAIVNQAGWTYDQVKTVMKSLFNIDSSTALNMGQYDELCNIVQNKSYTQWESEQNMLTDLGHEEDVPIDWHQGP